MTQLFTLPDLAERNGLKRAAGGRLLGCAYRDGGLQAVKLGRKLYAEQGDFDDWIKLCRERSCRPASISDKAAPPAGLSVTAPARSAQATAQATAKMLMNSGKPSVSFSPAGSPPRYPRLPRIV